MLSGIAVLKLTYRVVVRHGCWQALSRAIGQCSQQLQLLVSPPSLSSGPRGRWGGGATTGSPGVDVRQLMLAQSPATTPADHYRDRGGRWQKAPEQLFQSPGAIGVEPSPRGTPRGPRSGSARARPQSRSGGSGSARRTGREGSGRGSATPGQSMLGSRSVGTPSHRQSSLRAQPPVQIVSASHANLMVESPRGGGGGGPGTPVAASTPA
jgi:hypothetical protein